MELITLGKVWKISSGKEGVMKGSRLFLVRSAFFFLYYSNLISPILVSNCCTALKATFSSALHTV